MKNRNEVGDYVVFIYLQSALGKARGAVDKQRGQWAMTTQKGSNNLRQGCVSASWLRVVLFAAYSNWTQHLELAANADKTGQESKKKKKKVLSTLLWVHCPEW